MLKIANFFLFFFEEYKQDGYEDCHGLLSINMGGLAYEFKPSPWYSYTRLYLEDEFSLYFLGSGYSIVEKISLPSVLDQNLSHIPKLH